MKKYYLQAYLHLKTILTREIYGLEGDFFNDYIFVQNAIIQTHLLCSHLILVHKILILFHMTWYQNLMHNIVIQLRNSGYSGFEILH